MNSIFKTITIKILNKSKAHADYWDNGSAEPSTTEHMGTASILALLIVFATSYCKWAAILYLPALMFYSVFWEFVIDRKKNQGRLVSEIWAQIMERSIMFFVFLPLEALTIFI